MAERLAGDPGASCYLGVRIPSVDGAGVPLELSAELSLKDSGCPMRSFREILGDVCMRPGMWVGRSDFDRACTFLIGYDTALRDLRPDLKDTGFNRFREWLAVRLDSCVNSCWSEIILREDTGSDKFQALERLFDEFERDRSDEQKMKAVLKKFYYLDSGRERTCWCELPPEERDNWKPGYRRQSTDPDD
jgi:hypothetical protein